MKTPPSSYFTPIDLAAHFNQDRRQLSDPFQGVETLDDQYDTQLYGAQAIGGIPFAFGDSDAPNALLLDQEAVTIPIEPQLASYVIFVHAVEDRVTNYQDGFADFAVDGNELGDHVSDYTLTYDDGDQVTVPILRRFAIQQSTIGWGASAFTAVPAKQPEVFSSASETLILEETTWYTYGWGETRHMSGRGNQNQLWLYALPNPHPDKPIQSIVCVPRKERSLIYGIALSKTAIVEHPLRPSLRQKIRLQLPDGAMLNKLHELVDIDIDMGTVISARAALDYDRSAWLSAMPNAQPQRATDAVVVEYAAHPQAKLYVGTGNNSHVVYDLAEIAGDNALSIPPAHRPIKVHIVDQATGQPVAARLHMHGVAGEYLPPKNHHRLVNPHWFEDNYAEFVNGLNQYSYVPGQCDIDLPLGTVYVEITRGYEITPIRTVVEITPETDELRFELERVLDWRARGWVTADTHVHFLSPQTALLEGQAEGVNVVNLLASQWGEMFSNVGDFDGRSTLGAKDFSGSNNGSDGEFLVRVGTENRMQALGHISLLGYSGHMINPLCTGGPDESAIGDAQEVTMAQWAQRCIDQGGLVIMPHAPNPQLERAADAVLGLIHGMEMMTFNPHDHQINPYGLADWYRYLNLGYQIPVVGGSDKMFAAAQLGGMRTYTQMGELEFTYEHWMAAVKAGNTFVTVGPLVEMQVEGEWPGSHVNLPAGGGTVNVSWQVASVSVPIDQVEIVVGGLAVEQVNVDKTLSASGSAEINVQQSTWIALRVRGSYKGEHGEIAAHTSAVQVLVEGQNIFAQHDAIVVLEQIEGAIAYVDTLAPRPDALRFKQLRATLETAHNRLHQRMHKNGIYHDHTLLHEHH